MDCSSPCSFCLPKLPAPNSVARRHQHRNANLQIWSNFKNGTFETAAADGASWAPSSPSNISPASIVPTDNDVIYARGNFAKHPENGKYHSLIQLYAAQYMQATKHNKYQIISLLISEIERNNGRFLRIGKDGGWVEDEERRVRERVRQGLRDTQNGIKLWKIKRKASDFLSHGLNVSDLPKDSHGHSE